MTEINNPVSRLVRRLQRMYGAFWLSAFVAVGLGEWLDEWTGSYAGHALAVYVGESAVILLTALCVPLALKLFVWWQRRYMDAVPLMQALTATARAYRLRLLLLALPLWGGLLLYYLTWSVKGVLCAAIVLTASLFCWPGAERLRRELRLDDHESQQKGGER